MTKNKIKTVEQDRKVDNEYDPHTQDINNYRIGNMEGVPRCRVTFTDSKTCRLKCLRLTPKTTKSYRPDSIVYTKHCYRHGGKQEREAWRRQEAKLAVKSAEGKAIDSIYSQFGVTPGVTLGVGKDKSNNNSNNSSSGLSADTQDKQTYTGNIDNQSNIDNGKDGNNRKQGGRVVSKYTYGSSLQSSSPSTDPTPTAKAIDWKDPVPSLTPLRPVVSPEVSPKPADERVGSPGGKVVNNFKNNSENAESVGGPDDIYSVNDKTLKHYYSRKKGHKEARTLDGELALIRTLIQKYLNKLDVEALDKGDVKMVQELVKTCMQLLNTIAKLEETRKWQYTRESLRADIMRLGQAIQAAVPEEDKRRKLAKTIVKIFGAKVARTGDVVVETIRGG